MLCIWHLWVLNVLAIAEMIAPEVNKELLAELELMGFSVERSTRALHFSGSTAVNCLWTQGRGHVFILEVTLLNRK